MTKRVAALALACLPANALADHPVSPYGTSWLRPSSFAEVDFQMARYELAAGSGHWQRLAASVEIAPWSRLSVFVRLPVAHVDRDAGGDANGLGDVEAGAKLRVIGGDRFGLLGGLAFEVPTGDPDDGIGGGHLQISPWAMASAQPHAAMVARVLAGVRLTAASIEHEEGRAVLSAHGTHETIAMADVGWVGDHVYATAGLEGALVLAGEGDGFVAARGELGARVHGGWRFSLGGDRPISGDHRHEWLVRAAVAYEFSARTDHDHLDAVRPTGSAPHHD